MSDWTPPTELPDLRRIDLIALDTETKDDRLRAEKGSGWPFGEGYVCGASIAYREDGGIRAHYFPLRHPDSVNFDPAQVFQWLRDHVASGTRFIGQNISYDLGWLRTEAGIAMPPGERLEEILALAALVDENRYDYSLDALCRWRGLPGKDETLLIEAVKALGVKVGKRKNRPQAYIWQLPARYVGPYAEADAANTLALWEDLNPILDQEGTRDAYRLECDLLPMVHEMRRRGIRIDTGAAEQARDLLLQKRDAVFADLADKLGSNVGMEEIGRTSWLATTFDRFDIKYPHTEKGAPSFTAGSTGWMPHHPHWLPQLIVRADKYNNAAVNVLEMYILGHVVNGRIHAEIHPHRGESNGTKSFRFSYSNPPLQLMPSRDEELAPLIRGVFLPEEGEVWAKPDASQQEFRLLVHHGHEHGLRKAKEAAELYRVDPAADFHKFAAELTGLERACAKGANFGKIYGMGPDRFAATIGKSAAEGRAIYDQYDRALPFAKGLAEIYRARAQSQGYITLYDGRRRHFNRFAPGGKWKNGAGPCELAEAQERIKDPTHPWYGCRPLYRADARNALNALIQGSAAIHTKLWMRACWREGIIPLLQMHDALECSVGSREQAELIARLGEEAVKLDVPMRVDLKFGRSWGDAKHSWEELHGDHETHVPQDELRYSNSSIVPEPASAARPSIFTSNNCVAHDAKCRPASFIIFPDKTTPVEAAISLAAQGVQIFPAPPSKKKSYKSEKFSGTKWGMTKDLKEIKHDFKHWPKAQIGLPTGKENGFFVVEADTKEGHDVDGIAGIAQLEAENTKLPPTLMARSPSGSLHYYFRHPGGNIEIRNSQSSIAPGVDVRGDGGMVIAPPSRRHDGQYCWCNANAIAESPDWLLDLIFANQVSRDPIEPEPTTTMGDGFDVAEPEPIEKIKAALAVLDPRKLGHDDHLKVACALFKTLGDAGGFDLLTDWLQRFPDFYDAAIAEQQWGSAAAKNG
jgi:DNA polymerase I-like protein with 3'-5' exonuclease and polymerase domains